MSPMSALDVCPGNLKRVPHDYLSDSHELRGQARPAESPEYLCIDFGRLALVPSTPAIRAIYREAQQALRAVGCNACVFEDAGEAAEWLEGRAVAGRAAS